MANRPRGLNLVFGDQPRQEEAPLDDAVEQQKYYTMPVDPAREPKSIITGNLRIDGNIQGGGALEVHCIVHRDVSVDDLIVGETGQIEGVVAADRVLIKGRLVGSVSATSIALARTAQVDGDLTHDTLEVEAGAFFRGRSASTRRPGGATTSPSGSMTTRDPGTDAYPSSRPEDA
jgi:cytoskeletal protein CcmA (bactofilin family)